MESPRTVDRYAKFTQALARLRELLLEPEDRDYLDDAIVRRFEFTYEMAWKALKAHLEANDVSGVGTPREALRAGFEAGLISSADGWSDMVKDRNLTSHTYDVTVARAICERIRLRYVCLLSELEMKLGRGNP